jgi:hypothetical protein
MNFFFCPVPCAYSAHLPQIETFLTLTFMADNSTICRGKVQHCIHFVKKTTRF